MFESFSVAIVIGLVIISVAGLVVVALGNCALSALFTSLIIGISFQLYVIGEWEFTSNTNAL